MPRPETTEPGNASEETKRCPYCAEVIKAAAIKCRYCHSDLTGAEPTPAASAAPTAAAPAAAASAAPPPVAPDLPAAVAATGARTGPLAPVGRTGWAVVAGALLVTLTLLVLTFLDWREHSRLEEARQARTTAQAAVSEKVEALLSYDHESFDEDMAAAQETMTARFREEYAPTVESIRERALSQRRSQAATVVAASVLPTDEPDRAELLLFVDTVSAREGSNRQRVLQNRVKVTMVRDGETWLIDDLTVPQS